MTGSTSQLPDSKDPASTGSTGTSTGSTPGSSTETPTSPSGNTGSTGSTTGSTGSSTNPLPPTDPSGSLSTGGNSGSTGNPTGSGTELPDILGPGEVGRLPITSGYPDATGRRSELVIDLSYYQDPDYINYNQLSSHIRGAILRAGYTGQATGCSYYKDTAFDQHYQQLKSRGIPVGAYWYSCATTPAQGREEARAFVQAASGKRFDLPIYWDTEDKYHQAQVSPDQLTDTAIAFIETLRRYGYNAGIYGSSWWLNNRLNMVQITGPVWVAHYGVSIPSYRGRYGMWQFTSSYHLPGYGGNLDASRRFLD